MASNVTSIASNMHCRVWNYNKYMSRELAYVDIENIMQYGLLDDKIICAKLVARIKRTCCCQNQYSAVSYLTAAEK
jgi:hypothetical protein